MGPNLPTVKLNETEDITEEAVTITLKRAINFYSTLQASDGHWPAESAGPLFFLPPLVSNHSLVYTLLVGIMMGCKPARLLRLLFHQLYEQSL